LKQKSSTKGYLLGVDAGNSKTHALIADVSGKAIGLAETGCGSYEVLGPEGYAEALQTVTREALATAGINKTEIRAMGFGLAGYDWPPEKPIMVQGIESLGIDVPYEFVNDVVIGLIAGASEGWGVAVDAGTGNNVRGRDKTGRNGRITGNSSLFGEFGGAGELVWRAMISVTYAWTQRGPKTALTRSFMNYAEVETEDALIESLAMQRIHLAPTLAKEIFRLAADGDQVAKDVIQWTARELGENVNAVIRQIDLQDMDFEVILIGSLFNAGEAYIAPLRETIHAFAPGANLIRLSVPPVVGSILLAAESLGHPTGQIRQPLIESTKTLLTNMNIANSSS
jgi:N-acetylglucosamine kinase-like BadF-type ATPase